MSGLAWRRLLLLMVTSGFSLPAFAHGGGLLLVVVGLPLLVGLYTVLLVRAAFFVPKPRRGGTLALTFVLGPVWVLLAAGPLLDYRGEIALREFEGSWSVGVPLLLAVLSWCLQNRLIRARRPHGK